MTRIVATSDLHGFLPDPLDIPEADLLIIAGDICPDHPIGKRERYGLDDKGAGYQAEWLDSEFRRWLDRVCQRVEYVVAVWGNHDFVGEQRRLWEDLYLPVQFLQDETVEIGGLKIHGTPWVPGLPRWAFHGSEEFLKARAESIPSDLDILISHGPPYGTADFVAPQFGSLAVGDRALAGALGSLAPKLFVCGHIHEQYGLHEHDDVIVANVSYVDENYVPGNAPMDFLVEPRDE